MLVLVLVMVLGPLPLQVPLHSSPAPSSKATRSSTTSRTSRPSSVAVSRAVACRTCSRVFLYMPDRASAIHPSSVPYLESLLAEPLEPAARGAQQARRRPRRAMDVQGQAAVGAVRAPVRQGDGRVDAVQHEAGDAGAAVVTLWG